jgi:hypothetical protein
MRFASRCAAALTASMLVLTACSGVDRPTSLRVPATSLKSSGVPYTGDLPDMIVDAKATQNNWINRVEDLPADACSVEEGGITPGEHNILRFTVTTPNIGKGDVFVGNPLDHVAANDGLFEFAQCHNHFHFKHYAIYRLIGADGTVWKAAKKGFCMLDVDPYNIHNGDGTWTYRSCGTLTLPGFQGISTGWADTYVFKLGGQYFVLDGGDGQPVVPPGVYTIEVEVNPPYAPDAQGHCPRAQDPLTGLCHQFAESDYTNNIGRATVIITDHPGRAGYGTIKDNSKITPADEIEK